MFETIIFQICHFVQHVLERLRIYIFITAQNQINQNNSLDEVYIKYVNISQITKLLYCTCVITNEDDNADYDETEDESYMGDVDASEADLEPASPTW